MEEVFVVMSNDFPDAVFRTDAAAEAHCEAMRKKGSPSGHKIYWRVYKFQVR